MLELRRPDLPGLHGAGTGRHQVPELRARATLGPRASEAGPGRARDRRCSRGDRRRGIGLASLAATPFGFFGFLIAYGVGRGTGELVLRAAGRFRGQTTGAIAAAGSLGAYLAPFALVPLLYGDSFSQRFGVIEVVLGAVAGFFAYRQAA